MISKFIDAKTRGSDRVEIYKIGKLLLRSIEFRHSLLEQRRGPKWSEEKDLRRMERQVWKIMSRVEKKPRKYRAELTCPSKESKLVTEADRNGQ